MDFEEETVVKKRRSTEIRHAQANLIENIIIDDLDLSHLLVKYADILQDEVVIETGACECAAYFENMFDPSYLEKIVHWTRAGMCSCVAETQNRDGIASFTFVHFSVAVGHVKLLNALVDKGCDLNKPTDYMHFTPLCIAIMAGNVAMITALLSKNIDVNLICGPKRIAPLMFALERGSVETAKLLLSRRDINANVRNSRHETALVTSLRMPSYELFNLILESGADPNMCDARSNPPLLLAVAKGINYVRRLIEKGADVNGTNRHKETPLFYATYFEQEEIVRELIKAGANIEAQCHDGRTILAISVYQGHTDLAKLIVDTGADINKPNDQGYTAFHIAAWNGHVDIVKYFLKNGAKFDELTNDKNTPLGLAAHGDCPEVIKLLLPLGCKVNNADKDLDTAIHYATYNGMTESVKLLLKYGADPNLRNRLNTTPLWNAVYMKHKDVVKLLLTANVDLEVKSCGINQHAQTDNVVLLYPNEVSPFYVAVQRQLLDILLLLKTAGYNIYSEEWFYKGEFPEGVEDNPNLMAILKQFASTPPRLITVCRNFLRKYFGNKLKERVNELEIPNNLKNYLLLQDFLS